MTSVIGPWAHQVHAHIQRLWAVYSRVVCANLHIGEYKISARSTDHSYWTLCDGRSLDRVKYSELFAVIGTTFGSEDESSFNLPDFRGRVMGFAGQGGSLSNRAFGEAAGAETHVISEQEMPSHAHTGTTAAAGSHTHTTNAAGGSSPGLCVADGSNTVIDTDASSGELNVWTTPRALTIDAAGSHTHAFTTGSKGGNSAMSLMQPTLFAAHVFIFSGVVTGDGAIL